MKIRALLAAVAAVLVLTPAPAYAGSEVYYPADNTWYTIHNAWSGKCLDIAYLSQENMARAIQATCWDGWNQQWKIVRSPDNPFYFSLIARHSGKCLDVKDQMLTPYTLILQYDCWGGTNQQWALYRPGSGSQYFIVSRHALEAGSSAACLDIMFSSRDESIGAIQNNCAALVSQNWSFFTVA